MLRIVRRAVATSAGVSVTNDANSSVSKSAAARMIAIEPDA